MPIYPNITIQITDMDNTEIILQCLRMLITHQLQGEAEAFILEVSNFGLKPAIQKWFNVK